MKENLLGSTFFCMCFYFCFFFKSFRLGLCKSKLPTFLPYICHTPIQFIQTALLLKYLIFEKKLKVNPEKNFIHNI